MRGRKGDRKRDKGRERDEDDSNYFDLNTWAPRKDTEAQRGRGRCPSCIVVHNGPQPQPRDGPDVRALSGVGIVRGRGYSEPGTASLCLSSPYPRALSGSALFLSVSVPELLPGDSAHMLLLIPLS